MIFAYAHLNSQHRSSAILLHELIWRRHMGPIPERMCVVHRNHISMDNRLDNMCLINIQNAHVWYTGMNVCKMAATNSPSIAHHRPQQSSSSTSFRVTSTTPSDSGNSKIATNDLQLTLYWAAIQQLPPDQVRNRLDRSIIWNFPFPLPVRECENRIVLDALDDRVESVNE